MSKTTEDCAQAGVDDQERGTIGPDVGAPIAETASVRPGSDERKKGPEKCSTGTQGGATPKGTGEIEDGLGCIENGPEMAPRVFSRAIHDRPRMPGEVSYRSTAIYNQCRHCRGWEGDGRSLAAEIEACPNRGCPLWDFRTQTAASLRRRGGSETPGRGEAIRQFCDECQCIAPGARRSSVRDCVSTGCHLWPWRSGSLCCDDREE